MNWGALRRLLLRLVIFAAPVIGGLGYAEWRLRSVRTIYDAKHDILVGKGSSAEVVILGSSHAANGIDPGAIECSAVNLAIHGQTLDVDAAIAGTYLPMLSRVRLLIVPVALFSLDARFDDMPDHVWQLPLYRRGLGIRVDTGGRSPSWLEDFEAARIRPRWAIEQTLRGFPSVAKDPRWLGWTPGGGAAPGGISSYEAMRAARTHRSFMNRAHREDLARSLHSLIALGRGAGAQVVLLLPPFHFNYNKAWTDGEISDFRSRLGSIARKAGARVADYSQDPRFSDSDFADGSHLSEAGARRFSRMISGEVVAPAVRCRTSPGDVSTP